MPAVYNAFDILCSASATEGSPNVVLEAMACGVPCVVTDVGDSARIVADTGIVVPSQDPGALAEGLAAMLARLPTVESDRLRRRVETYFSVEAMVDATERALLAVSQSC